MTKSHQRLGRWGETLAAQYLAEHGYAVIARNYRTHYGEIDLIAMYDKTTVFVEVKTGKSGLFGRPEVSVNAKKQAHLVAAVQEYMQNHPGEQAEWRIDVIAIQVLPEPQAPVITHFENAINV